MQISIKSGGRKPPINQELLDHLAATFPDTLPREKDFSERGIAYQQGQRSVVDYLIMLYEEEG